MAYEFKNKCGSNYCYRLLFYESFKITRGNDIPKHVDKIKQKMSQITSMFHKGSVKWTFSA